jgi:hypothetical protein
VAACQWINRHLRGDTGPAGEVNAEPLPGKELRVFPEDKDVPADALNGRIDETFVPRAEVTLPEAGKFEEWKKGLMRELRTKSFRSFPERVPPATERARETYSVSVETQPAVEVPVFLPITSKENPKVGILVVRNPGEEVANTPAWVTAEIGSDHFHVVTPRTDWTVKSPPNYVERSHALVGQTVDQGKVWDIAAVTHFLAENDKNKRRWKVMGRGQAGVLAAYAALIEPSISEVVIVDPPASHRDGPIFLNVLRVLDVSEALGLLAPRPLTLVNAKDKSFDRTAEIYRVAGAADKLQRK